MSAPDNARLEQYIVLIEGVGEIDDVSFALRREAGDIPADPLKSLVLAFVPEFRDLDSAGEVVQGTWVNRFDGTAFDPELINWETIGAVASHPNAGRFSRGRLGHLLWCYKPSGSVVAIADDAIAALQELASDTDIDEIGRVYYAAEAASLARRRKAANATQSVLGTMLSIAKEAIDAGRENKSRPGVAMRALAYFSAFGGEREDAAAHLQRAIEVYNRAPIRSDFAEMLISISTVADRVTIAETEIDRMLADALTEPAFRREHMARTALTWARRFGLKAAQGRAAAAIAEIQPEDYDLKTISSSVTLPQKYIDAFRAFHDQLRTVASERAWQVWLMMFPKLPPHEERPAPIVGAVEALATRALISEQGHVTDVTADAAKVRRMRHFDDDRQHYELLYTFAIGPGLQTLLSRDDARVALGGLIDHCDLLSNMGKNRVKKALAAFDNSQWEEVADCIPTIEAGIRKAALLAGVSPYAPAGEANQFKTLGGLIAEITDFLPEPRFGRFWAFALTEDLGYNLRNEYLHGIKEVVTQFEATLILQVLIQVVLLKRPQIGEGRGDRSRRDDGGASGVATS